MIVLDVLERLIMLTCLIVGVKSIIKDVKEGNLKDFFK